MMAESREIAVGEFIELEVGDDLKNSSRYNDDIAPTLSLIHI